MRKQLPEGDELEQRCRELGIDMHGPLLTQSASGRLQRDSDDELQRRLIEAERSLREGRLWLVALASAIASAISAATALIALFAHG